MLYNSSQSIPSKPVMIGLVLLGVLAVSLVAACAVWSLTFTKTLALFFLFSFPILLLLSGERRRFVLGMLMFVIPFNIDENFIEHPSPGGADGLSGGLVDIFLILLLVFTLARTMKTKRTGELYLFPELFVPSLALFVFYLISFLNATDLLWSAFDTLNYLKAILLFWLVANNIRSDKDLKVVLISLFLGLVLQVIVTTALNADPSLTGLFLKYKIGVAADFEQTYDANMFVRSGGTFGNANHLGRYLGLLLPIAYMLLVTRTCRGFTLITLVAAMIGTFAIIYAMSRSAWAGITVSILVMIPLLLQHRFLTFRSLFVLMIGAGIGSLLMFAFKDIIWARLTMDDHGSAMTRITTAKVAFRMIQDYPFVGCGINNYAAVLNDYWIGEDTFTNKAAVHNNYLLYMTEIGILGFTAFLWVLIAFARRILKAVKSKTPFYAAIAIGLWGAFVGFLLNSLTDKSYKENFSLLLLLWTFMAITEAIIRLQSTVNQRERVSCQ